jgi:2-polyprenyl-3-methyl-5-hydroxy-6-metoxy-1,4-benzoquinol methylase
MSRHIRYNSVLFANILVIVLLALVPFYAFVSVWSSTLFGHFILIRLWDEVVLTLLVILTLGWLTRDKPLRQTLLGSRTAKLAIAYILLTIVLGLVSLLDHHVSYTALAYGSLIDLRFLIWFICVFAVALKSDWLYTHWRKLVLWPLSLVVFFGLLQFFVLPKDFLTHFGYGRSASDAQKANIAYTSINQDSPTMRIQSFLRGPNPLGAYLAIMLGALSSLLTFTKRQWYIWLLAAGTLLALFLSFSRSAWIGAFIILGAAFGLRLKSRRQQKVGIIIAFILAIFLVSTLLVTRHSTSIQNALLHTSSHTTASQTSNQGHLSSFHQSLTAIAHQPLGEGPGTSGQASWYNTGHHVRNTESYILQIGEEVGWVGLFLFTLLFLSIGRELWQRRNNYLARGLWVSLLGLLPIMFLSYAWADDTLAYVWWSLAAIALAQGIRHPNKEAIRYTDRMLRAFINWNRKLSKKFDAVFVPRSWLVDGLKDYVHNVVPPLVQPTSNICDVGGGKRPFVGLEIPKQKGQYILGIDIDETELKLAPDGIYDQIVVSDISAKRLPVKANIATLVICEAVLEHVQNNTQAIRNMAKLTKKGGEIVLFIPSRNALFAVINRHLPQKIKRKLLFSIFPESEHAQGFPAYYNYCTPKAMRKLLEQNGIEITQLRSYYFSTYFSFFLPAHILWRLYQFISFLVIRENAAESFSIVGVNNSK